MTLAHAVSGTGEYASVTAESVSVTITENDTAIENVPPDPMTMGDYCGDAIWCATVKLDLYDREPTAPSLLRYEYHPRVETTSLSDDRFSYQGTDYSFTRVDIHAHPEEYNYGPPGLMPGNSWFGVYMGGGGTDWYSAILAIPEEHYRDWTIYFEDFAMPFSEATFTNGHRFLWKSAEWSIFDNSGADDSGVYRMRIEGPAQVEADAGVDTDPPEMVDAGVRHDTLTMTYNEELTSDPLPGGRIFYVAVQGHNGPRLEIEQVSVNGENLVLTLERPVGWDELVLLHCLDMPRSLYPPITDLAGNRAEPLLTYMVPNLTPQPPRYLTVSPLGGGELRAGWFAPRMDKGSPAQGYKVQWKEAAGSWENSADVSEETVTGISHTSHTITGLTVGVPYAVRVIAVHNAGDGPPTDEVVQTPIQALQQRLGAVNSPAAGLLVIDGVPLAGQILTADTSGIIDDDGLDNATFSYQWLFSGGSNETEIEGATESAYTLTEEDQGKAIKVRVTFTDDAGNEETLTSVAVLAAVVSEAVQPNTPATGQPTITGRAQVGKTLKANVSDIADADGLDDAVFTYQWIRNDGNADTDIQDATGSSYTLSQDDEGKHVKVRVSFTDDRGNDETVTGAATDAVAPKPNSPATGQPTIGGTAQVSETLTASTSGIYDDDGLDKAVFTYQWIRVAGGTDTEIAEATGSSHTLGAADLEKSIKVRVEFTDGRGHQESLTSQPVGPVDHQTSQQQANSPATGQPTISGTAQVGKTLEADTSGIDDEDGISNATFSYQWVSNDGTDDTDISGATGDSYALVSDDQGKTIKVRVSFTDDADNDESRTSGATDAVAPKPNSAATGAPAISGTAQVGETLEADTSGIGDDDGMDDAVFAYQWIRNDGNADTDIQGATDSTHTLSEDDQGKSVKVRVSFADDRGHDETLTSTATAEVAGTPADPLTASLENKPASHNGVDAFTFELRFSEGVKLSYKTLQNHAFDVTGGSVTKAQRLDKPSNVRWRITVEPDSDAAVTVVLAVTTDCSYTGAVCTADGRMLSNRLDLTVSGPGG